MAPGLLLGAAKDQILGQSLSDVENHLVFLGGLGLLHCVFCEAVSWAPEVGGDLPDIQCLEAAEARREKEGGSQVVEQKPFLCFPASPT